MVWAPCAPWAPRASRAPVFPGLSWLPGLPGLPDLPGLPGPFYASGLPNQKSPKPYRTCSTETEGWTLDKDEEELEKEVCKKVEEKVNKKVEGDRWVEGILADDQVGG